jgi:hypothetical protein
MRRESGIRPSAAFQSCQLARLTLVSRPSVFAPNFGAKTPKRSSFARLVENRGRRVYEKESSNPQVRTRLLLGGGAGRLPPVTPPAGEVKNLATDSIS